MSILKVSFKSRFHWFTRYMRHEKNKQTGISRVTNSPESVKRQQSTSCQGSWTLWSFVISQEINRCKLSIEVFFVLSIVSKKTINKRKECTISGDINRKKRYLNLDRVQIYVRRCVFIYGLYKLSNFLLSVWFLLIECDKVYNFFFLLIWRKT